MISLFMRKICPRQLSFFSLYSSFENGLNPIATKRFFEVAGEAVLLFLLPILLTAGFLFTFRFLLGSKKPFATTDIPVFKACLPACFRRGVA